MIHLDAKGWWLSCAGPGCLVAALTSVGTAIVAVLAFLALLLLHRRLGRHS